MLKGEGMWKVIPSHADVAQGLHCVRLLISSCIHSTWIRIPSSAPYAPLVKRSYDDWLKTSWLSALAGSNPARSTIER